MTARSPAGALASDHLSAGRQHRLLAVEIADAVTLRTARAKDTTTLVVEFNRYDAEPMVVRSLPLDESATAPGVYVRGGVPFHLRVDVGDEPATRVVLAERARVRVFSERDAAWPPGVYQTIVVVTPIDPR